MATPSLFALIERAQAGRIAGRMLAVEARVALALAVVFFLVERRHARQTGRALSAEQLLVLGALFCTVAGYFALQPMMEAARAGQGAWSFGALHAVSVGFYAFKTGLVLLLAWRLAAR